MTDKSSFRLSEYDEVIRTVLESGGEFRLYPKGTSMLPLLRQGRDSVVLVRADGDLKKNDIAFYLRDDGHYVLHRVIASNNGCYTMCGDNQTEPETGIKNSHIIGTASKVYRKDRCIKKDAFLYRAYLFVWRSFFVRKVYFKLRRLGRLFKNDKKQ